MAHILIVDDQVFFREYLAYELQQEGHRISYGIDTNNLGETVDSLQPDIVLIDPFYEELYGYRMIEYLKERYPRLPVVLMSVYDSRMVDSDKVPCDGCVTKNVDTTEIKSTIHEILISQLVKEMESRCLEYSL